jgi:hypothetical protein
MDTYNPDDVDWHPYGGYRDSSEKFDEPAPTWEDCFTFGESGEASWDYCSDGPHAHCHPDCPNWSKDWDSSGWDVAEAPLEDVPF